MVAELTRPESSVRTSQSVVMVDMNVFMANALAKELTEGTLPNLCRVPVFVGKEICKNFYIDKSVCIYIFSFPKSLDSLHNMQIAK